VTLLGHPASMTVAVEVTCGALRDITIVATLLFARRAQRPLGAIHVAAGLMENLAGLATDADAIDQRD
jgi:hypothetical protein